jgi:hypothetical protein
VADLGFSGVVEKFEEHWGKRLTRWLLLVIGLGVAAVCVGAIWQWIVSPVLAFLQSPHRASVFWALFLALLGVGGGLSITLAIVEALVRWRRMKQVNSVLAEAHAIKDTTSETSDAIFGMLSETEGHQRKSMAMMKATILLMRAALEADKSLSAEDRAERLGRLKLASDIVEAAEADHLED